MRPNSLCDNSAPRCEPLPEVQSLAVKTGVSEAPMLSATARAIASMSVGHIHGAFVVCTKPDGSYVRSTDLPGGGSRRLRGKMPPLPSARRVRRVAEAAARKLK